MREREKEIVKTETNSFSRRRTAAFRDRGKRSFSRKRKEAFPHTEKGIGEGKRKEVFTKK